MSALASATAVARPPSRSRLWISLASALFCAWNAFGFKQFIDSVRATPESLMAMGMTAEQAQVYSSYPLWMTAGFAVGVCGGLLASALLLARHRFAVPAAQASLAGYVVLYIGDITEGVFAALGAPQIAVLTTVLLFACALAFLSRRAQRAGLLA